MDNNFSEYNEFNIHTIINYIQANYKQIILIVLVFIIIYLVDYINGFNAIFFAHIIPGIPLIPGSNIPGTTTTKLNKTRKPKNRKK